MEFIGFDDDLFEQKEEKHTKDTCFLAKQCEDGWFLSVADENYSKIEATNIQRYQADYHFLNENYSAATEIYKTLAKEVSSLSAVVRRDIYEGLTRCFIETKNGSDAKEWAYKVHQLSINNDHLTVSYLLLFDACICDQDYNKAVLFAQNLIDIHQVNSDMWLKLSLAYALLYDALADDVISLLNYHKYVSKKKVSNTSNDKGKKLYIACLIRSLDILNNVLGTSVGFTTENNKKYQEIILSQISKLNINMDFIDLSKKKMTVVGYFSKESSDVEEFIDRGSSKYKPEDNNELSGIKEIIPAEIFENKWFSWIS